LLVVAGWVSPLGGAEILMPGCGSGGAAVLMASR
jgi:hypothetical protein